MSRNTLKSFQWSFVSALFRKAILFAVFLLVAKAITKVELGIFREFSLVLSIFTGLSFFGLKDLLMVKKENLESNFKSIFSFSVVSSIIFGLLLYFLAPFIGRYYKSEVLSNLLRILSPLIVIEIYRSILRYTTQKKLKFKFLAIIETTNVVVYSLLIVAFYFINLNIKNLIIIFYIGNICELLLYLFFERKLVWSAIKAIFSIANWLNLKKIISENFKFLYTTSFNNLISMLSSDLPVIILGYLYNPIYIGIYYLANQLVGQIVVLSCNSLSQVLFPTFTLLSKSEIEIRLNKFFNLTTLTIYPLYFLFVIFVLTLTPFLLGEKWIEALPVVAILAFPLATTIITNPIASIPYVFEKPHYEVIYFVITTILKSIALIIGSQFGFLFALKLYAVTTVVLHFLLLSIIFKIVGMSIVKTNSKIILQFIPSFLLVVSYMAFDEVNMYLKLLSFVIVVMLYLAVIWRKELMRFRR